MSSDAPVRWGILGTGNINRRMLPGARAARLVDLVAVASRDPERASTHAAELGIPRALGCYEALLADPAVEAVDISLPNALHHPWTMRALAAGKHVLCEKPCSRRAADVAEAFDAAERGGLVLSEAFMWRHSPQTRRLVELLPAIGELQVIRATFGYRLDRVADVRLLPEVDGGSLMDVGCYCVNAARLLTGAEPEAVHGESVPGPTGTAQTGGHEGREALPVMVDEETREAMAAEEPARGLPGEQRTTAADDPTLPDGPPAGEPSDPRFPLRPTGVGVLGSLLFLVVFLGILAAAAIWAARVLG